MTYPAMIANSRLNITSIKSFFVYSMLRASAQSLVRELHPQNIHIGHFVIDGEITNNSTANKSENQKLGFDALAQPGLGILRNTYLIHHKKLNFVLGLRFF